MNTDYWFDKRLAPRIVTALTEGEFRTNCTITVHEDGDKAMLELTHFQHGTADTSEMRDRVEKGVKLVVIRFIQGFVAGCTTALAMPDYVVGHEGRSGYRLDQTNRVQGDATPRRFHSVVSLPASAIKGDAEAARHAAYDGIHQFCQLNGIAVPVAEG
jgi:hypothetical protein